MEAEPNAGLTQRPLKLAICGGGASAVLLLCALRKGFATAIDVTVIEPREHLGLGVAYSTDCPLHLLNTRARNMSVNEDGDDFFNWLREKHRRRPFNWTRNCFAPRQIYGQYLTARLLEIRNAPHIRFHWVRSTADSIVARDHGWEIVPAKGQPIAADIVILATGNETPRSLSSKLAPQARPYVNDDPWHPRAKEDLAPETPVLLVGTGLTAVDVAIELLHRGHSGKIYAVSRRGLLPRRQGPVHLTADVCDGTIPTSLRGLVHFVRHRIESDPRSSAWQTFVNELRLVAPAIWGRWSTTERRQFLRHVRPFWDVHRHRIAPQVHSQIARAIDRGQLTILRARLDTIEPAADGQGVHVRLKQVSREIEFNVARVINCTGPEPDPRRGANTLLRSLLSDGLAQPDPLGLGLAVDSQSRVVAAHGSAHPNLYALGPLSRGSRWEATAVAEIREQAASIARRIAREVTSGSNREPVLAAVGTFRQALA